MNEMTLLKSHGPAATELRADVRDQARAALLNGIARSATQETGTVIDLDQRRRKTRTRVGLVAACVAGVALLAPSTLGLNGSAAVALVSAEPMTFPFTPTGLPATLGEPVFERDSTFIAARYGSALNAVSITTNVDDESRWDIPDNAPTVDIAGHTATLVTGTAHDGTTNSASTVALIWEDGDHEWTAVRGSGTYADASRIEAIAKSLRETPQPVDLALDVAPKGWSVAAYKEDRILILSRDGKTGPNDLTVSLLDGPIDLAADARARDIAALTINGQTAHLGRTDSDGGGDTWILTAKTTNGQAFSLQAPAESFTRDQIIQVAEGVTYRP